MIRVLTALLLFLTACAGPSGVLGRSSVGPPQSGEHLGAELSTLIRGLSMSEGRKVVSLDLCNNVERTLQVTWAVEWMDSAGATCPGTPSNWQETRLKPGASASVEIKAPTPQAATWRIIAMETGS